MKNQLLSTTNMQRYLSCLILALFVSVNAWAIPPVITFQPTNEAGCPSTNVAFVVNASYTTSYQWQVNTGGGFVNVVNGGVYSGATTNVLTLTGITGPMDGYLYQCICTGPDAPAATSNSATLTVYAPAAITVNPATNTTVCHGDNTSYTVTATGSGLTYQWYGYNGVTYVPLTNSGFYSGVTTATLDITGITTGTTASTYSYYCIVTGNCNFVSTPTLYLTVNTRPAVTAHPVNFTTCAGDDAFFEVTAVGTNRTYQWQVSYGGIIWTNLTNTGGYANVTTREMKVTTIASMHGSQYRCVVSGDCTPTATSNPATLTVNNAVVINTHPSSTTVCPNASTSFTVALTGSALTYQWQVNTGGGWTNLTNTGIYSDVTTHNLKLTNVTAAYNNYKYRCIVSGTCSTPSPTNEATLTLYDPAVVTSSPATPSTICDGDNFSYTVTATGSGLTYQWYEYNGVTYLPMSNGGVYSGVTTPTLNITGIASGGTIAKTYSYFCVVTGTCNNASSNTLYLTVNARPAITVQPVPDVTCLGNDAFFEVTATGTNLTYQWQVSYNGVNWANLTNTGGYANVTTREMKVTTIGSMHGSKYRCIVSGDCTPSVTSNSALLTVEFPLSITIQPTNKVVCPGGSTSFNVTVDGQILTYQWQSSPDGLNWTNLTNTGIYSDATTNSLKLTGVTAAYNNLIYRCVVDGKCSVPTNSAEAILTLHDPAVITANPTPSKTICSGDNSSFTIAASGTGLSYQWYQWNGVSYDPMTNGGVYSGVTTPTLNITGITTGTTAITNSYFCFVSGLCNTAQANTVYLTVNALPALTSNPVNTTVCSGLDAFFNVTATGTTLTYQWQKSTNGVNWSNLTNGGGYANVTTSQMKVTTSPGIDGTMYRCVVSGACTPSVTSTAATLTVNSPLAIQTQPLNESVCPGDNAAFVVTVAGTNLTYQWQLYNGTSWDNLTNTGIYSGATTRILTLTSVHAAHNNGRYRCLVNGQCSLPTASSEGLLTVNVPASITVNPATNTTICDGDNMVYNVTAAGTNLTYQWFGYNGTGYTALTNAGFYSGVTTSKLTITGITAGATATTYSYFCVVTGPCNNASTNTLYLTVNVRPAITVQPINKTICSGGNTTYSVTATGTGISYQWQVNDGVSWTNITNTGIYDNATTATLKLTGATTAQHGYEYRCRVSGACTPVAVSNIATLDINTAPVVTINPLNRTICEGSNTTFSVSATGTALTYQWQVHDGSAWANVTNTGIYSNATTATLSLTAASTMQQGYKYRCVVSGTCPVPATSAEATLTIRTKPVVTADPVNTSVCPAANTTFSIAATGTNITYLWEINTGSSWIPLANTGLYSTVNTPTLTITGALVSQDGYQFRCRVSGACSPDAVSAAATLTLNTFPTVTMQPVNTSVCLNGNTSLSVMGTGTAVAYQWQVSTNGTTWSPVGNTTLYGGATTNTLSITSAPAYITGYQYRCMVSGTCTPSAPSNAVTLTVNQPTVMVSQPVSSTICETGNASFNVAVTGSGLTYQWEENTGSGWTTITNTGLYSGATSNKLMLSNVPASYNANQYRCIVTGLCAPTMITTSAVTLTVNTNVVVNTQPASATICSGTNTSLSVGATGTGLAYQWYTHNGTTFVPVTNTGVYTGATTGTLNITGLTATTATVYTYYCVLTGACNTVYTNTVQLTVNALPVISSNPSSVTICDSTLNIQFDVTASGTGIAYQWQVNTGSSWTNLSNGGNISGATTSSLKMGQVFYSMNGYEYRCVVSGACTPNAVSTAATLTVTPLLLPSVTVQASNADVCAGTLVTHTATPVNGGVSPSYQWKLNGANVGTNSATYVSTSLNNNDLVWCEMTSNYSCPTRAKVNSNVVTMKVTAYQTPTAVITSSGTDTVCSGVMNGFSVATTFAGTTPTYQWQLNGVDVGASISSYLTDTLNNNDVVRCIVTSSFKCPTTAQVSSNNIAMTVNQTTLATVSIGTGSDTTVCNGREVVFTADTTNGGTDPKFQWIINGVDIFGDTTSTYSSFSLKQNDVVSCRFTSSATCVFPVESDTMKINITQPVAAEVDLAVSYQGNNDYTFTATPTNGGTAPVYEWDLNGSVVNGVTGPVYTTSTMIKSDKIRVKMISNHPCVITQSVFSRRVTTGIGGQENFISDLKLYPNPNTGKFTITGEFESAGIEDARITIINTLGQLIYNVDTKVVSGKLVQEVNLNNDPAAGVYIMRIDIDGQQEIRRFNITK